MFGGWRVGVEVDSLALAFWVVWVIVLGVGGVYLFLEIWVGVGGAVSSIVDVDS